MKDQSQNGHAEQEKKIDEYWGAYARAFIAPLHANGQVGNFVSNPAVTGAYAEAWVNSLVGQMVTNLVVSTGAIIRTSDFTRDRDLRTVPQIDLIFWDPAELPALFRSGRFALVHALAARGIIEVKRRVSDLEQVRAQLKKQRNRLLSEYRRNVLGVVVSDKQPLDGEYFDPKWVDKADPHAPPRVIRLLDKHQEPDADGIFTLIYFLSHLAQIHRGQREGSP